MAVSFARKSASDFANGDHPCELLLWSLYDDPNPPTNEKANKKSKQQANGVLRNQSNVMIFRSLEGYRLVDYRKRTLRAGFSDAQPLYCYRQRDFTAQTLSVVVLIRVHLV